ncbi:MAG TPA: PKD domain-containing protein, partial [Chitinophagales bacterium]|nr:PKD domain-containing protein [Chitinophagales bacterium]
MKIRFTLATLIILSILHTQAQITLSSSDMPTAGWSEILVTDSPQTNNTIHYGNSGANQTYDFSGLTHVYKRDTVHYVSLNNTQQTNFPSATVAATLDYTNYVMLQTNSSKNDVEGLQGVIGGHTIYVKYSPVEDLYHFTTQYGATYSGSWGFRQAIPASWVGQGWPADSVILTVTDTYTDTIDGWGKVVTPVGAYKGLRDARKDTRHTNIVATTVFSTTITVEDYTETTLEFSYLAKETKGALVSFDYDSAGNVKDAKYSLTPPAAPVPHFTWAAGGAGVINFTDNTDGYPTTYSWNFGDGNTSNQQNPSHTYTYNGTYYVCETVTNAGGSNTYCDSVHVTNNPAPVAHFTWAAAGGGLINFTNTSTGSPTTYAWTFGDGATSSSINPGHTYAANGAYYVCLTVSNPNGSNTYCDSVHVTGIVASHQPPVAVNDTSSVTQPAIDTINVTANDYSPSGDAFCITAVYGNANMSVQGCNDIVFHSSGGSTGADTGYYIICNTVQTTLCDTGMVLITVSQQHLAPVAVDDTASVLQPNGGTINVTANDHSPSNDAFCITAVYGSNYFSQQGCNNVTFAPDSTFTGNDTAWYVVCNTNQPTLCDTAMLVVTDHQNPALLPVVSFTDSLVVCDGGYFTNTSANGAGAVWVFHDIPTNPGTDSTMTGNFVHYEDVPYSNSVIQVCLTVTNQFGSVSKCDTVQFGCEGINELQLAGINMYPNPAASQLVIDMSRNTDAITSNYTAIEIYNAIGEKVMAVNKTQGKTVKLDVAALPAGIYLAAIVDGNGTT